MSDSEEWSAGTLAISGVGAFVGLSYLQRTQVGVWLALGLLMVAVAAGRFLQCGLTTPQPDQLNVPSPSTFTTSAGASPTPGEVQAHSVVSQPTIV